MDNEYQILKLLAEFEEALNKLSPQVKLEVTQVCIDWLVKYQEGVE